MRSITAAIGIALFCPAYAVEVYINTGPARCGLNNGAANAQPSGGIPPYTFLWSTGSTEETITQLAPGDYTVTVTDGLNNTAQATTTIAAVWELWPIGPFDGYVVQPDCQSQCTGIVSFFGPQGGTPPYTFDAPITYTGFDYLAMGLCAGMPMVFAMSDANGCPGTIDFSGLVIDAYPSPVDVTDITGACESEANGTITVVLNGMWASQLHVVRSGGGYDQIHGPSMGQPYTITGLPAGDYLLISEIPLLCSQDFAATVPEIQAPCGSVSGIVYNDADQDCAFDAIEYGLPYRVLTIEPGPEYAITDQIGAYYAASGFGSFTLAQPLVDEAQLCPASVPAPFTIDAGTPNVTLDLADSSFVPLDTRVSIWSSAARPGFPTHVHGQVQNLSAYPSGVITLTLSYDPLLDPVTVSPAPTSTSPGSVQWDFAALAPYQGVNFSLHGAIPADIGLLGTTITYSAVATDAFAEINTANNTETLPVTITGSYDPNDKLARTSSALSTTQYFLDEDEWIVYTIRFQNTGTDTAFTVIVRDSLEADLDPATLEILGASHTFTPSFENGRTLVFTFPNIQLPDSGTDFAASNGSVHFRIRPKAGIAIGDIISNGAGIYFDFNPPVITNTSELFVELSTGMGAPEHRNVLVFPVPATDLVRVSVKDPAHRVFALDVLAADGRIVLRENLFVNGEAIDVHALPTGHYLILLRDTDGGVRRTSLLKH